MFDKLVWRSDRLLLDDLVFRLESCKDDDWELGDNCFVFFKSKPLVDQYAKFWSGRRGFSAQNIFELGMWDGGSVAFWFEYFQPQKHVGIDLQQKQDSRYFSWYVAARGLQNRIRTYWSTDQAEGQALRMIVQAEFSAPLDLVIDDASHLYQPTKQSFETLFPLLRPGGLYVIEDWAWGHWSAFQKSDHPWKTQIPLTRLVFELAAATGSWEGDRPDLSLISSVTIFQGFTVVERGGLKVESLEFRLDSYIKGRRSTFDR